MKILDFEILLIVYFRPISDESSEYQSGMTSNIQERRAVCPDSVLRSKYGDMRLNIDHVSLYLIPNPKIPKFK